MAFVIQMHLNTFKKENIRNRAFIKKKKKKKLGFKCGQECRQSVIITASESVMSEIKKISCAFLG